MTTAERKRQAEEAMLTPAALARRKRVQEITSRYAPRATQASQETHHAATSTRTPASATAATHT